MWIQSAQWLLLLIPLVVANDSMESVLNAYNRRPQDLADYRRLEEYGLEPLRYEDNDELAFLPEERYSPDQKDEQLQRVLLNYLIDRPSFEAETDGPAEHVSSSFRERIGKDRLKPKMSLNELLMSKMYIPETDEEAYSKYYKNYDDDLYQRKRSYYSNLGYDSIGLRKRNRFLEPSNEAAYQFNYPSREDVFEDSVNNPELMWKLTQHQQPRLRKAYLDYPRKRFPVSKRSSSYYPTNLQYELTHQQKRSTKKDNVKTDPKVVKELSGIFNAKSTIEKRAKTDKKPAAADKAKKISKEEVPSNVQTDRSVEIEKKSVGWSDYFGLDRKKKSDNDLDNEWLLERYHKAIALSAKRSNENPSQKIDGGEHGVAAQNVSDKVVLDEMEEKLKSIEDSVVDDALKFTGAHSDAIDSKEILEVKNRIISRLATAYRVEKLRRALQEYRQNMRKDLEKSKVTKKRLSVARKEAVDTDREKFTDETNNIKCVQGDENCMDMTYNVPTEFLRQSNWENGDCPRIKLACNQVSAVLGAFGPIFESACNLNQMCLLCGDNSWGAPTRQCNLLFVSRANELCEGDAECQRLAHQSLKYLSRVNRALRSEPQSLCNFECPPPDKR